jgi:hypothetical protein
MFRKIASLSVALIVASGVMIAVPADAAVKISNGVKCKKSGQTTKTSLGNYRCSTNPLTTSKKLTWLSVDCLATANGAVKAASDAVVTAAKFKDQIPVIELGIAAQNLKMKEIQAKIDDSTERLAGANLKLAEAKTPAAERVLETAVRSWTSAIRAYGSEMRRLELEVRKLESAKLTAQSKPEELAANIKDIRATARLICTRGL